jgi:hypothetical protein
MARKKSPPAKPKYPTRGKELRNRYALRLGNLPRKYIGIGGDGNILRRALEELVVEANGTDDLTPVQQMLITTACRWERVARLTHQRIKHEQLTDPGEIAQVEMEVAKASTKAVNTISKLGIGMDGNEFGSLLD